MQDSTALDASVLGIASRRTASLRTFLTALVLVSGCAVPSEGALDSADEVTHSSNLTSQSEDASLTEDETLLFSEGESLGQVTGYAKLSGDFGDDRQTTIYVDDVAVELDLIWPYSAHCVERELVQDKAFSSAQDALQKLLPLGTYVLVVKSGYEKGEWVADRRKAFVHVLDRDSKRPISTPPSRSVNEQLVLTGFWVPFEKGFEFDYYTYGAVYGEFNVDYLSEKQEEYAPLILAAGNEARSNQAGAMPVCNVFAINYLVDGFYGALSAFRDNEEEDRLWWIKYRSSSCRDGDGDGVCYER